MQHRTTLDADLLRHLLKYEPSTGEFIWSSGRRKGRLAGTDHSAGYRQICIGRTIYLAHRLAWLYVHGCWPAHNIDHINGNRADNRISNLRDASDFTNAQNKRSAYINNESGLLGVSRRPSSFHARIHTNGESTFLGAFTTAEGAHQAYLSAKKALHPGATLIGEKS